MHHTSEVRMTRFAELCKNYFSNGQNLRILDVGGVGVSYRNIFKQFLNNFTYYNLNIEHGYMESSTDILVHETYNWKEVNDNSFDIVISGQTIEHAEYPWLTFLEMRRVLKPGGWLCIIAPSHWPLHRAPLDTYRYYADGLNALAKYAGFTVLYVGADHPGDHKCGDAYLVAKKTQNESSIPEDYYKEALNAQLDIIPDKTIWDISQNCSFSQSSHHYEHLRGIGSNYNIISGNFTGEYAIHTALENNPSLLINLPQNISSIHEIQIFNRKGFESRSQYIYIYISRDMLEWTPILQNCGRFGGIYDGKPLIVAVNQKARAILFQCQGETYLHFDQIRILAHL